MSKLKKTNSINSFMKLFYEINPGLNFGNKTQRKAMEFIINKFGEKNTEKLIKYAIQIQSEQYAPIISTPLQLKNKLGDLNIYQQRNRPKLTNLNKL